MKKAWLSAQARRDLQSIRTYYSDKNAEFGLRLVQELRALAHRLAKFPIVGADRSDLRPNLRCVAYGDYLVFYFPTESGVDVVHFLHSRRNITGADFPESE
jgi:toxin ParE1/3/4